MTILYDMTIGELAMAVGTLALAGFAAAATWLQRYEMINSVRPCLLLAGSWLLHERAEETAVPPVGQAPLELVNFGRGPALWVQWEVGTDGTEPSVPRTRTYATRLDVGGKIRLWHTRGGENCNFEVPQGMQITIWCDDLFGKHYRYIFEPRGDARGRQWVPTYQRRECQRSSLF